MTNVWYVVEEILRWARVGLSVNSDILDTHRIRRQIIWLIERLVKLALKCGGRISLRRSVNFLKRIIASIIFVSFIWLCLYIYIYILMIFSTTSLRRYEFLKLTKILSLFLYNYITYTINFCLLMETIFACLIQ